MSQTLAYIVIIALIANLLSVSGLRCHQCNSHDNEDCVSLVVNTPRAQRDDQYLRDCAPKGDEQAFCRKTIIQLDVNEERRIERSCGWIQEKTHNACFTADNEGYKQTICTCSEDGCNAAPALASPASFLTTSLCLAASLGCLLRH
ncbi:uncharacterized protein LOC6576034 [Drosophila mojavensis]|uniref:Uncharacterized protein n=1 Tax=Drosophila mojavensis TaxID=7230 RepID=B4KJN4_DROMO|nr:uncharacterized protein LOC6576034 [Drosophila mojavensis]XP_032584753.1 uncharacterized protein LOC6576034 [Drosophila mojavensis]EDW11479.1 uncharacterized protein Dmoj_GI17160 [Drosophila mojavensis]